MKLSDYLQHTGISLKKFARKIDCSISAVSRWANENRLPRPQAMKKIEKATNGRVTIEDWYA